MRAQSYLRRYPSLLLMANEAVLPVILRRAFMKTWIVFWSLLESSAGPFPSRRILNLPTTTTTYLGRFHVTKWKKSYPWWAFFNGAERYIYGSAIAVVALGFWLISDDTPVKWISSFSSKTDYLLEGNLCPVLTSMRESRDGSRANRV